MELIFGKGTYADYAPWLAGQLASVGVGCFTGLGKGIYQLANQKSSNVDLAEGGLNIILSFVGGSKTILKASAALKGTASGAKIVYEEGINFVKKAIVGYEEKEASAAAKALLKEKGLSAGGVDGLFKNLNIIKKAPIEQEALKKGAEQTAKKIDVLVNAAKEDIKAIPGRGYEAFADLVNKEYAFTLEGIKKSVLDTIGKSSVELMDNFLGSKADEALVDWVSSLFESEGITLSGDSAKNTSGTTTDTNINTMVVNGAIHIVSTPPGADIWLDNSKESLQTPNTLHEITPGDHKVVLKIPGGYQDYARTVSVIAGQTAQISAKLEPLPAATGNLRIASDQSDATIVIDGTTQDVKTPAGFKNVPVGSYKVTVKKAGFQDYSETVTVEPLQERQVWAPLKPLQLAKGTLNIGSVPAGADIYIDGQKQGSQTPANNIVEARTYKVGLKKAGYKDYSATATVMEGRITELWAKLEAVESEPASTQQPTKPAERTPQEKCDCCTMWAQTILVKQLMDACKQERECISQEVRITKPWTYNPATNECVGSFEYWKTWSDGKSERTGGYDNYAMSLKIAENRCQKLGK